MEFWSYSSRVWEWEVERLAGSRFGGSILILVSVSSSLTYKLCDLREVTWPFSISVSFVKWHLSPTVIVTVKWDNAHEVMSTGPNIEKIVITHCYQYYWSIFFTVQIKTRGLEVLNKLSLPHTLHFRIYRQGKTKWEYLDLGKKPLSPTCPNAATVTSPIRSPTPVQRVSEPSILFLSKAAPVF